MNNNKIVVFFFFQAEDGIRDADVTGVQTCALPIATVVVLTLGLAIGVNSTIFTRDQGLADYTVYEGVGFRLPLPQGTTMLERVLVFAAALTTAGVWSSPAAAAASFTQGQPAWQRTESQHFEIHYLPV